VRDSDSPIVVLVVPVPKCDQEAGIRYPSHVLEKPFREERLAGPDIFPAKRMKVRCSAPRAFSSCSRMILPWETPALVAVVSNHWAKSSGSRTVIVLRICLDCNTLRLSALL
jgi:hypothetical protein